MIDTYFPFSFQEGPYYVYAQDSNHMMQKTNEILPHEHGTLNLGPFSQYIC